MWTQMDPKEDPRRGSAKDEQNEHKMGPRTLIFPDLTLAAAGPGAHLGPLGQRQVWKYQGTWAHLGSVIWTLCWALSWTLFGVHLGPHHATSPHHITSHLKKGDVPHHQELAITASRTHLNK